MKMLFDLLDSDGSGDIGIEEFRRGCLKLQGSAKSREMIKLATHISSYNRNLDDMQDAIDDQNTTLRRVYNRLYDMEKRFFRPVQRGGKEPKDQPPENDPIGRQKKMGGPVSILGAAAAAGRHVARRSQDRAKKEELKEVQKRLLPPSKRSLADVTSFIGRKSVTAEERKEKNDFHKYYHPARDDGIRPDFEEEKKKRNNGEVTAF